MKQTNKQTNKQTKRLIYPLIACLAMVVILIVSCQKEEPNVQPNPQSDETIALAQLKSDLSTFNADFYKDANQDPTTKGFFSRFWRVLKKLAVSDALGGLAGGGATMTGHGAVVGAIASSIKTASGMLYEIDKNLSSAPLAASPVMSLAPTNTLTTGWGSLNLNPGISINIYSQGYVHNAIIEELYRTYGTRLYSLTMEQLYDLIAARIPKYYPSYKASSIEKTVICNSINKLGMATNFDYGQGVENQVNIPLAKRVFSDIAPTVNWSEIDILDTAIEGSTRADSELEAISHYKGVLSQIDATVLSVDTKTRLKEAVSVGVGSRLLWNVQ